MTPSQAFVLAELAVVLVGAAATYIDQPEPTSDGSVEVYLERIPTAQTEPHTTHLHNVNTFLHLSAAEFNCLATNIYHEAKYEPYIGKIAVAQVTHTRVQKHLRGSSFCSVVYAPHQFSWTSIPNMRNEQPRGTAWIAAQHAAQMYTRGVRTNIGSSDHYHADYIAKPRWTRAMQIDGQIARHVFYTSR